MRIALAQILAGTDPVANLSLVAGPRLQLVAFANRAFNSSLTSSARYELGESYGLTANYARKLTMLICAVLVTPIFFAQFASNVWLAVAIVGLATAAHQAFSANLYTIPSDMFPRKAVGSVVGIGGMVGAIGGMGMAKFTGYILQTTGSYTLIFAVAGSVYLIAVGVIHLLSPRLARVDAL